MARKYTQLDAATLEGLAYDSVFKQLCGKGELKTSTADRVLSGAHCAVLVARATQESELRDDDAERAPAVAAAK